MNSLIIYRINLLPKVCSQVLAETMQGLKHGSNLSSSSSSSGTVVVVLVVVVVTAVVVLVGE